MPTYILTIRDATIQERFDLFLARHPEVYSEFREIALQLLNRGKRHYGAKAIMEIIRFHRAISGVDEKEPFKINNTYVSRFARKLIDEDARFADFFETRELRAK